MAILGRAHCKLVEYVLCDPELGWNLRNEVAHGTVRADALTPTRVLLAWLLVVRLTCFVAEHTAASADTPEAPAEAVEELGASDVAPAAAATPPGSNEPW